MAGRRAALHAQGRATGVAESGGDVAIDGGPRAGAGIAATTRIAATTSMAGTRLRTGQVVRILGISRRQLQYWADTGLVEPSARTAGGHRRYTFHDLVALRAARQLIDAGVSVQRIRRSVGALKRILPRVRRPLSELVLVATGDVVLVLHEGAAFEAVSGQEWVFEVARFERELARWLRQPGEARRAARTGVAGGGIR